MQNNPFKFGSIVDDPYFINRIKEISRVKSVLNSNNHLILISPRRFGKSSLIYKVVGEINRPVIALDLQLITSVEDFAAQLLKRIYRLFPFEKVRQFVKKFRIIPTISVNPVTNEVDITFHPESSSLPLLEDVLNLIEKLSNQRKKIIVVFDEFQEVHHISKELPRQLRSIMQHHQQINYVFLGSQESLIREIFEKKKSSFYHFGLLMPLGKIPEKDFISYLQDGLKQVTKQDEKIAHEIIGFTGCHPYYTQQLSYLVWEVLFQQPDITAPVDMAISEMTQIHDIDYERLWNSFNKTDKKIMIGLSVSGIAPLSDAFKRKYYIGATSTVYSSIKRLMGTGYITKDKNKYEIDDPFFKLWIKQRRER